MGFDLWQLDQTDQASVNRLIQRVNDTYGRIDFLFLNAGQPAVGVVCGMTTGALYARVMSAVPLCGCARDSTPSNHVMLGGAWLQGAGQESRSS